jgi:LytS/YehU family sensor histidine kinase
MINDLSEAKLHRMQAQYENLRNHIHPHFLFNALNTLKILIHKDPDQAEAYILKVSEFLRSSLQSTHRAKLPVADDLRIAVNYLQIQEVRFKNCFELHIEMDQIASSKGLPILAIQSLFENILKHNRLSKAEPIHIWVKTEGPSCLVITNTRIPLESERMESTGTGLFNLSERFKLLGGQPIEIQETPLAFVVKMYYLEL